MTFIYERDPYSLEMTRQGFRSSYRLTDIQTDRRPRYHAPLRRWSKIEKKSSQVYTIHHSTSLLTLSV